LDSDNNDEDGFKGGSYIPMAAWKKREKEKKQCIELSQG
jgi:hypothetical protein